MFFIKTKEMFFPQDVWKLIMLFIEGVVLEERREWWKKLHLSRKKNMKMSHREFSYNILFYCPKFETFGRPFETNVSFFSTSFESSEAWRTRRQKAKDNYASIIHLINERKFMNLFIKNRFYEEPEENEKVGFTHLFQIPGTPVTGWQPSFIL